MTCPYSEQNIIIPEDAHKLSAPLPEHFPETLHHQIQQLAQHSIAAQEVSRRGCKGEFVQCVDVNWQDSLIQNIYGQMQALGFHMRILSAGHSTAVAQQKTLTLYVIKTAERGFHFADAYTFD
jgi:hypothetical protein